MKPRTGISMYGNNVAIEANGSASMKDAWGGSVSLSTGVASLTGRETSVNGMAGVAYKWIILKNLVEIQYNAIMGFAYSMTNKDPNSMLTGESAQIIVNAVKKFLGYFEQIDSLQSARKIMVNREVIQPALKALKEAREALERAHDPSGRTLKEQEQAALDAIDNEATLSDDERKALKEEIKNDYKAMSASFANTLSDNEINDYNALYDQHFSKYQGAFWLKDQFTLFGEQIFQGPNLSAYRNAKMVRTPTP